MPTPPAHPKIYHITPVNNLPSIIADGGLASDAAMIARGGPSAAIGMSAIKERRLALPVKCRPGDYVGDYVPFYFCPRSVMLYVIYRDNHPELTYHGGQGPILHLEADLHKVVNWANGSGCRWALSLSNAGAKYAPFRATLTALQELNWEAIEAIDFRAAEIKEGKQAEFLVRDFFPWELVERVGVCTLTVQEQVLAAISTAATQPAVEVQQDWYYY